MERTHFINPYTFVPLAHGQPVIKKPNSATHAWFEPTMFTGSITCELTFITPAVIAGKQKPGTSDTAGEIETYSIGDRLAIPGSRLRGHLSHLMKAINSSPLRQVDDRVILERIPQGSQKKGFIIDQGGVLKIQQVADELLAMHPGRYRRQNMHLACGCRPATNLIAWITETASAEIPLYDAAKDIAKQGIQGHVCWERATWGPGAAYKNYLADDSCGHHAGWRNGRWVKFPCWSGQDGKNRFADLRTHAQYAHWNQWHLVDLNARVTVFPFRDGTKEIFLNGIKEMGRLVESRSDETEQKLSGDVESMAEIHPGTFVYFELDSKGAEVVSFGRHFHYLKQVGSVEAKVRKTNQLLSSSQPRCAVQTLFGWTDDAKNEIPESNEEETEKKPVGMKSRLWVDMAKGPLITDSQLEYHDLRILSSQPPKAACFYLKGGGYAENKTEVQGRKFYWHDPKWQEKRWDNEDLRTGTYGFENPIPQQNKKQWSRVQVLMANETKTVSFTFMIRAMNLNDDEVNLLLTALVGIESLDVDGEGIHQSDTRQWCHKIGHDRPFLGSAHITVKEAHVLKFDLGTLEPRLEPILLSDWRTNLISWQKAKLKCDHLEQLKRVMRFEGAYEDLREGEEDALIQYPLAAGERGMTWVDAGNNPLLDASQPKTYTWFAMNKRRAQPLSLPSPSPGTSQALPIDPINSPDTPATRASTGEGKSSNPDALGELLEKHGKHSQTKGEK